MNRNVANKLNNIFGKMRNSNITRTFRNNQYLKKKKSSKNLLNHVIIDIAIILFITRG